MLASIVLALPVWFSPALTAGWTRAAVTLAAMGIAVQIVSLALQWTTVLTASLGGMALLGLLAITGANGPGLAITALLGGALLLAAEFGYWSVEIPARRHDPTEVVVRRMGRIGIEALFGLIVAISGAAFGELPVNGGTVLIAIAAGVACLALAVAIWWSRTAGTHFSIAESVDASRPD